MKKIAVIGSGSFLARNFIKYSIECGLDYQFLLYDYYEMNEWPQFSFQKIDFYDIEDIKKIDFSVDIIMIYLGKTGTITGFEEYKTFIEVNEILLLNILKTYIEMNSKARIIYPSSRLVFRSNNSRRISEDGERELKSVYAITKQAAEEYLKVYRDAFNVQSVIIRICTPIGTLLDDFGSYGTFEIFKNQAIKNHEVKVFGDGLQRKTFTAIEDICKAFSLVIDAKYVKYDSYNLGGQDLCLLDIAESIAREYGATILKIPWPELYEKIDGGSLVFDSTRFDSEFNMTYSVLI